MVWSGLEEDVVGIDISDGVITAARVQAGRNGSVLMSNAGWTEVPPNADEDVLAGAVRRVWRSSGLRSSTVCTSFRGRSLMVRYFKYPALTRDELESALRLEAEESLQLKQSDIFMDWHLTKIPRPAAGGGASRPYEGLLVAAPRRDVEQHLSALRLAGLYPVAVDIGAAAVSNVYQTLYPSAEAGGDVCLIHLTRQCADIALLFDRCNLYARTVYARTADWESSLDSLAEGVKDALKYYEFKLRRPAVSRLIVVGRLQGRSGLDAMLSREVGRTVEVWDPLARVTPDSSRVKRMLIPGQSLPPMTVSLGLALRRFDHA